MKSDRSDVTQRRALYLLLSGLLVTLIILGAAQWTSAEDGDPTPPTPDRSEIYKEGMPTLEEAAQIEDPVERYLALEMISPDLLLGSDLSFSSKTADRDQVPAGSTIDYTIVVSNSGDAEVVATMVDALPQGLTLIDDPETVDSAGVLPADPEFEVDGNEVTWKGNIAGGGYAELLIKARVNDNVPAGTKIVNSAEFSGNNQTVEKAVTITVLEKVEVPVDFLPIITFGIQPDPPDISNLSATRPNSQNRFRLSWTGGPKATHYIVEQANDPSFSSPIQHNAGQNAFLDLQPVPSWRNDLYFRVRAFEGVIGGNWSEPINVVGAYHDDFNDGDEEGKYGGDFSGWEIRRTTHLDHVNSWYEFAPNYGWLVLEIGDKWDWGLVSSMAKAPEPPYVIEFDAKFAQTPNEVAMGFVFGGDFPEDECPEDRDSTKGWYEHDDCFNTFYNPQWYWAGEKLHLIWQRVDELVWCPGCGGSPMKRRGDTENLGQMSGVDNDDWNSHRVEVRDGSIRYFASKKGTPLSFQHEYNDTRYINQQYFGVFAYAGEYTSSVARYENFTITPLDN